MPPSGSTFTDWQDDEHERPLLMDEDFSWSEPPARARRSTPQAPARQRRSRTALLEREPAAGRPVDHTEPEPARYADDRYDSAPADDNLNQYRPSDPSVVRTADAEFEAARQQWSDAYSSRLDQALEPRVPDEQHEEFDRDDVASYANARVVEDRSGAFDLSDAGRRTVIITGRGDHRYVPEPRRRRGSELRFHERSGFNPDRAALWAVLLGVMLLIGCIAH